MNSVIVMVSAFDVLICCIYLIFHSQYEDGIIGRAALGAMAFAAFLVLYEDVIAALGHGGPHLHRASFVGAVLWSGIGVFMARHVIRFRAAIRRAHPRGSCC